VPDCHGYSNLLLVWQAVLKQQAKEALLSEGTLVSQATHTDAQHIQVHGLSHVLLLSSCDTDCTDTLDSPMLQNNLQVLVLESYAKRSEKLLQLLAEFHRRIELRVAHADRMTTALTAANTSQGDFLRHAYSTQNGWQRAVSPLTVLSETHCTSKLPAYGASLFTTRRAFCCKYSKEMLASAGALALHRLLPTASASLSRQMKSSLSKQADNIASLAALQHDADTAATVSHLSQQPAQLVLQAVAGGTDCCLGVIPSVKDSPAA